MSPEFLALLEERKSLGTLFLLLPVCLGFLSVILAAVKSRKGIALLYMTILALAAFAIPTYLAFSWWIDLSDLATSDEEKSWVFNHDGGGTLVGPIFAFLLALAFWAISVMVLFVRTVIARIRKTKEKRKKPLDLKASS